MVRQQPTPTGPCPAPGATRLEQILGPATVVVASGGQWQDPETDEVEDKLHGHWRLVTPATHEELATLKEARIIACDVVGGDKSGKTIVHPFRWPGSWHRKKEPPVLCSIETINPDAEISLSVALRKLKGVAGPLASQPTVDRAEDFAALSDPHAEKSSTAFSEQWRSLKRASVRKSVLVVRQSYRRNGAQRIALARSPRCPRRRCRKRRPRLSPCR